MLFHGKRQLSVPDAEHWVIANTCAVLTTLSPSGKRCQYCQYSGIDSCYPNAFPKVVEDEVLRVGGAPNVDKMFTLAYRVEEDIIRRNGSLPEPMGHVLPVENAGATTGDTGQSSSGNRRPGKCPGCGNEGAHWYKFCLNVTRDASDAKNWDTYPMSVQSKSKRQQRTREEPGQDYAIIDPSHSET